MNKRAKLLDAMRNNPRDWRIEICWSLPSNLASNAGRSWAARCLDVLELM